MPEVSWLFFQGANEDPYLTDTGRESNAEKQPTGSGPEGCDENGRRPILIATKYLLFWGQDTSEQINRPSGTGPLFSCFQALRAWLLSFGPSGTGYALSL